MTCDIAVNIADSIVWVASESTVIPIRCYDKTNTMVDYMASDFIPNARGLTIDPEGYLWVSDIENDKIYKVSLTEGVGDETGSSVMTVTPSANPFSSAVTLNAQGVSATVSVFDMQGRLMAEDSFQESWTWNSSAPAGSYVFVVNDGNGNVETLDLIKI